MNLYLWSVVRNASRNNMTQLEQEIREAIRIGLSEDECPFPDFEERGVWAHGGVSDALSARCTVYVTSVDCEASRRLYRDTNSPFSLSIERAKAWAKVNGYSTLSVVDANDNTLEEYPV